MHQSARRTVSVAATTASIAVTRRHGAANLMPASMLCQLVGSLKAHAASALNSTTDCLRFWRVSAVGPQALTKIAVRPQHVLQLRHLPALPLVVSNGQPHNVRLGGVHFHSQGLYVGAQLRLRAGQVAQQALPPRVCRGAGSLGHHCIDKCVTGDGASCNDDLDSVEQASPVCSVLTSS